MELPTVVTILRNERVRGGYGSLVATYDKTAYQ